MWRWGAGLQTDNEKVLPNRLQALKNADGVDDV